MPFPEPYMPDLRYGLGFRAQSLPPKLKLDRVVDLFRLRANSLGSSEEGFGNPNPANWDLLVDILQCPDAGAWVTRMLPLV